MKIAAIQFAPTFKDVGANLDRISKLVRQAAVRGAQLVVLPELCTTGYSFMSEAEARPFAESPFWLEDTTAPGTSMHLMQKLSHQLKITIVWGYIEIDLGTKQLYNAQALLAPDGSWVSYRKINRWGNDFLWAQPGVANPPVVKLDFDGVTKRVGLLICRDVRDRATSDWTNFYSAGDADIVAFSSNWGDGGFPAVSWMDFASENRATLVVANRWGQETCNNFGEGGTCIIEPKGRVHCEGLVWSEDCLIVADVE